MGETRWSGTNTGLLLLAALPALLTLYFSFNAGGFFAGTPAVAAVVIGLLLVLRITIAEYPFSGFGTLLALSTMGLGLYAAWVLASAVWSDSPARAVVEFDRALMYWFALLLCGSLPRSERLTAWAVRALAAAMTIASVAGLITRVLPEVWEVEQRGIAEDRLSFPITYWNGLGLLAGLAIVFCFHLCCSEREPRAVRALGAAALPLVTATLLFTFSRGAIAVTVLALVSYVLIARPAGLPTGLLAALPPCAIGLVVSYDADLLATEDFATAAGVEQGQDVALVLGLCALGAGALRLLLSLADARVGRVLESLRPSARVVRGAVAAVIAAAIAVFVAVGGPDWLEDQYTAFVEGTSVSESRTRLTDVGNNGRIDQWSVAMDHFGEAPLAGEGAGTYTLMWAKDRDLGLKVEDAHSLYVETLAELGIVGLVLLALAVGGVLFAFAARARGPARHVYAALFAAGLAWVVHAGLDWDWELPAVTLWFWALGGMALAAPERARTSRSPGRLTRVAVGLGVLTLVTVPALVAASQAKLNESVREFRAGNCPAAIDAALASVKAMPVRPQPFELLGYCDARLGLRELSIGSMRSAIDRDPENWELHYGLALVQGAAGVDPRAAAREARRLNPREPLAREAVERFTTTDDPRKWRRRARRARLPLD